MRYLILTQKNRTLEQITFDHNNENWLPDQISFRAREIKMKNRYIFIATFLLGGRILITGFETVKNLVGANHLIFWEIESILYLVSLIYNFTRLYILMNRNHFGEFQKHKTSFLTYFICTCVFEVLNVIKLQFFVEGELPTNLNEKYH